MFAHRNLLRKFTVFSVIGAVNTGLDILAFILLVKWGTPALVANVIGWLCAVCFSYAANSHLTFERNPEISRVKSMLRFMTGSALIALFFSSASIAALGDWLGVVPAKIAGSLLAVLISFVVAGWSIEGIARRERSTPDRRT